MFNNEENSDDFEIVIGDDSNLNISEVSDYTDGLKPNTEKKKNVIIPTERKKVTKSNDTKKNNNEK